MQDELEDNQEDYRSLVHEYWCDLLSRIEAKTFRKKAATQIKNIESSKTASLSDSNKSMSILRKKKASTGARFKQQGKKTPKQHSAQCYCVNFKNAGMHEQNYMSHNSEDYFGKHSD